MLDEPTNGLDVMAVRALRALLRQLRDAGHCVLFSSHVMQEVSELCDEVVVIAGGTVLAAGTPAAIRAQHRHRGARGCVRAAHRRRGGRADVHAILTVFVKEFRENLRERRTLFTALILGPLLGPAAVRRRAVAADRAQRRSQPTSR